LSRLIIQLIQNANGDLHQPVNLPPSADGWSRLMTPTPAASRTRLDPAHERRTSVLAAFVDTPPYGRQLACDAKSNAADLDEQIARLGNSEESDR
jgi:hypothetical protein